MLLREQKHLFVHEVPVIGILGYCDDGNDDAGRGRKVRSLGCVSCGLCARSLSWSVPGVSSSRAEAAGQ
jgi:hypothetical protein